MPVQSFQSVTPHIYRLEQPFLRGRLRVNVWLVRDAEGWVMVDAGAPGFEKLLEQVLAQTGGEKPRILVLTHGHTDHAAAAQRIREDWKIPIAAHRDEFPYLIGPARYASIKAKNPIYKLLQISAPPLVGRNVQVPLDDGSKIGELIAYHSPGHAPGLLAFLHTGDRALISGDTFMHLGKLSDPFMPFTYDMGLNHKSQARLITLPFDHLLVSHGEPIMNTGRQEAMDWVAKHAKKPRATRPAPAAPTAAA
jgi:glyoxylase-like metal-dependent hydrolase (beta-lactamase superfamily II)